MATVNKATLNKAKQAWNTEQANAKAAGREPDKEKIVRIYGQQYADALGITVTKSTTKTTTTPATPATTPTGASEPPTNTIKIKSGDTLSALAQQYGTTVDELMKLNPQLTDPNLIYAGASLTIPTGVGEPPEPGVPGDSGTPGGMPGEPVALDGGEAYFENPDEGTLIKFSEDPDGSGPMSTATVWLVEPNKNQITPFLSEEAFEAWREPGSLDTASIQTVSTSSINEGGVFAGYKMLPSKYGFQNDGSRIESESPIDVEQVKMRYGKEADDESLDKGWQILEPFLNALKSDPNSGVSSSIIDEVNNDRDQLALYFSALSYGGYSPIDIWKDLKRKQLVKDGRTDLQGQKVIDEQINAEDFYVGDGAWVRNDPEFTPPKYIGEIDMELFDYPIFQISGEAFKTLVKPIDWTTPEGRVELEKIQAAFYDVQLKQTEAKTEQDKAAADYEWKVLQDEFEKIYGFKLSDNANEAWGQLQQLSSGFGQRGLAGTGLYQEAKDKYLTDVRKADERSRTERMTLEEEQKRQYYLKSASPQEIATLMNEMVTLEDGTQISKAEQWGLVPSAETAQWFNLENLKSMFPDSSEDELKRYRDSIIEPTSGAYRSQIYQTAFANRMGIEEEKRRFQEGETVRDPETGAITGGYGYRFKEALEREKAYRPFTKAGVGEAPRDVTSTPTPTPTPTQTPAPTPTQQPTVDYSAYDSRFGHVKDEELKKKMIDKYKLEGEPTGGWRYKP